MLWTPGGTPIQASSGEVPRSLSGDDKRTNKILIQEREERIKSVEELQKALHKQREEHVGALTGIEERVKTLEGSFKALWKEQEARGQSLTGIESRIDDLFRKAEWKDIAQEKADMREKLDSREADVKAQVQVAPPQADDAFDVWTGLANLSNVVDNHAKMLRQHAARFSVLPAEPSTPTGTKPLESMAAASQALPAGLPQTLAERFEYYDRQLEKLTASLVDVHVNLLMHAVKTSRIAIRCTELTKQEQIAVLKTLEDKELLLDEDIRAVKKKFGVALEPVGTGQTRDPLPLDGRLRDERGRNIAI